MNALVNEAKHYYEETSYKLALKAAHYDFSNARDTYRFVLPISMIDGEAGLTLHREACNAGGIALHKDLVLKYIRLQVCSDSLC